MNTQQKLSWLTTNIIEIMALDNSFAINEDSELDMIGLDSLDIVELQMAFEDEFNVEVGDPITPLVTVRDLLNLLP